MSVMSSAGSIRLNPVLHLQAMIATSGTKERMNEVRGYAKALRDLGVLKYPDWMDICRRINNLNSLAARPVRRRKVTLLRAGRS